ncbi:MAG: DNA repair protein RadC [Proteobacteria bacterium]|nr:DNA repair protein RadC [Pseudomonadota bacterium]
MSKDSIQKKGEGHRQRLRDKYLTSGLSGFHDYEVIELLLTLATPRKDCKEAAKVALNKFKTFQAVLEASPSELCKIKGIGPVNLFGIKLVNDVANRYLEKKLINKDPINNSKALFDYLNHNLRDKNIECFEVIFLDAKNKVIRAETLFKGSLTSSSVYPREVARAALDYHAAALIFAHNHPSGDPEPSAEDIAVTRQLVFACKVMGVSVHEHIIIGDNKYYSFADHGYIEKINREFNLQTKEFDAGSLPK